MKISVIIPCYNAAAFVARAVESVEKQDYPNKEIIIVDDGSTDTTRDELSRLSIEYPAIQLILSENKGACAARNIGFDKSAGEYVLFLDADDELLPQKISSSVRLLTTGGSPSIVVGSFMRTSNNGSTLVPVRSGDPWIQLFNGELGCTCSNLFQRKAFLQAGKWNEQMQSSQEAELMHRILQYSSTVLYDPNALTLVHTEDSIISRRQPMENLRRYFDVRLAIFDNIKLLNPEHPTIMASAGCMFYGILHRMYRLNSEEAIRMQLLLMKRNIGISSGPGVSGTYRVLCSIFGFRTTERLFYSGK